MVTDPKNLTGSKARLQARTHQIETCNCFTTIPLPYEVGQDKNYYATILFHCRKFTFLILAIVYLIHSLCPTSLTCLLCLLFFYLVSCAPLLLGVCFCKPSNILRLAGVYQSCLCVLVQGSPIHST